MRCRKIRFTPLENIGLRSSKNDTLYQPGNYVGKPNFTNHYSAPKPNWAQRVVKFFTSLYYANFK